MFEETDGAAASGWEVEVWFEVRGPAVNLLLVRMKHKVLTAHSET
jgi:hypothetical protein